MDKTFNAKGEAAALVEDWARHWQREGRLEGGLDRLAGANLIDRIAAALSAREPVAPVGRTTLSADHLPRHADAPHRADAPAVQPSQPRTPPSAPSPAQSPSSASSSAAASRKKGR